MTTSELRRLSELRALLEGFAARHAAVNAAQAPTELAALRQTLRRLETATRRRDYAIFREADYALHVGIVALARVPQLIEAWQQVWTAQQAFHHQTFDECFPDARFLNDAHAHLVQAIASGEPVAAEDAARSHVEAVWFRLADNRGQRPDGMLRGDDALQRAAAYVAFSFVRQLRLEQVAAKIAFTSPGNLSRLFRRHHGVSFQGYVQKLRLEKAAELLRATRLPVGSIARRVGYRDVSRFGQHFKRRFRRTPSKYRRTTNKSDE
jgi:AraC-like DNA-binding protein